MNPNHEREREHELSHEDRRLIRAIDAGLRPAEPSAARRAALRAELEARIERGAHPWRWLAPSAAALAAAAVTLWLVRPVATEPEPVRSAAGELYALSQLATGGEDLLETPAYLPDDYRALALLIEGEDAEP